MINYIIPEHAYKIWEILSESYIEKATNIKQRLGLKDYELFAAIGWLAHDRNIYFINYNDELYLSNKEVNMFVRM